MGCGNLIRSNIKLELSVCFSCCCTSDDHVLLVLRDREVRYGVW